jgi:hypothetical protein
LGANLCISFTISGGKKSNKGEDILIPLRHFIKNGSGSTLPINFNKMDNKAVLALSFSMFLFGCGIGYASGYLEHLYYLYDLNKRLQADIDSRFMLDQELDELRKENAGLKKMRNEMLTVMGNHLPAPNHLARTETYEDDGSEDAPEVTTPDAQ